jgi:hypothetical protein
MRLYNFGTIFSQCFGMFVPCILTVPRYPLQCNLCLTLRCRVRTWQPLASADITVSVDPADSSAAFESEKITK